MKALIAIPGTETPTLAELPEPTPGPGELLIEVAAAAVNPADPFVLSGAAHAAFGLSGPVGLGYDLAGVVRGVGEGTPKEWLGKRVAALHDDLSAATRGQAELAAVPAAAAAEVPDALDLVTASTVALCGLTAVQGLALLAAPAGRNLLVTGAAGAVGGYAVALALAAGWEVAGLARPSDAEFLAGLGVRHLTELPTTATFDAVFDAAALQEDALAAVRDGGSFLGVLPPRPVASQRDIKVQTVLVQADGASLDDLLRQHTDGRLQPRVADTVPLHEAARAYEALVAGGARGRHVILLGND